jgi:hypothetical protein
MIANLSVVELRRNPATVGSKGNVVFETCLTHLHRNVATFGPSVAFLGAEINDLENRCAAILNRVRNPLPCATGLKKETPGALFLESARVSRKANRGWQRRKG